MNIFTAYFSSPVGWLRIQGTETFITEINFIDEEEVTETNSKPNEILQTCMQQLEEYFSGTRKNFHLPLSQTGTPFQQKVWKQLQQIPFGQTISYLNFSKQLGDVKAIRAAASANGKNNIAIVVPCHRVIGSNQKLVGYAGGLWRKKWLLEHEGKLHSGLLTFDF